MSSSDSYFRFIDSQSASAGQSGQYPNSHQHQGPRFNVPAVTTTLNLSDYGVMGHMYPTPVIGTANSSASHEAASNRPEEVSRPKNLSADSEGLGSTDNKVLDSPITGSGSHENDTTASAGTVLPQERTDQGSVPEPRHKPAEYNHSAGNADNPSLPLRPTAPRRENTAPKRKRQLVDGSEKIKTEKAFRPAAPFKTTIKKGKVEGSAQSLKSERFATKEYKASQSLRPPGRQFKPSHSYHDAGTTGGTTKSKPEVDALEVQYLVGIISDLIPSQQGKYFDKFENAELIEQQNRAGYGRETFIDEEDEEDLPRQTKKQGNEKGELVVYNGLNTNLKPMNNIDEIFADLTINALGRGLGNFLEGFGTRKLKIATLCSGTESPVLAMMMVSDSLKKLSGYNLEIEHVLSCEIEPFKQAYIQRNFKPTLLFRDVLELKEEEAHTAFGSTAPVPNDIDIMIAGSSCIDFSLLNNRRKEFGESGESNDTLEATIQFARSHRPTIVILENVLGFPWREVERKWHNIGFATQVAFLDSKDFYIPQTRQRGYMIGIRREAISDRHVELDADTAVRVWFQVLEKLQRRASSPFTEFIFPDDDEQLERYNSVVTRASVQRVPWDKCKAECLSYRSCNLLGFKKPVTDWENNGSCHVPDFCDSSWYTQQVERIWETVEINHLRSIAFRGYDMAYKCRCLDLSQSCNRENDGRAWGCIGCITAHASPYLTYRGGPLTGAEALALQGIPRERLNLNRETNKQLVDLTGNAMTSTAVGAAILAAIISCGEVFIPQNKRQTRSLRSRPQSLQRIFPLKYDTKWLLTRTSLTRDLRRPITLREIRNLAYTSMRLCSCKGLKVTQSQVFQQCSKCGHTSCVNCGIKPTHEYVRLQPKALGKRTFATEFEKRLREVLPPRLVIRGLLPAHIAAASANRRELGKNYTEAIEAAGAEECRLDSFKCDRGWNITYESRCARLVLICQRKWDGYVMRPENFDDLASSVVVQWEFYAKPGSELPANDRIRKALSHPIARLICSKSLFEGQWEVRAAESQSFTLEVVGQGEKVPSWEKKQGLENRIFKDHYVWSSLQFRWPAASTQSGVPVANHIVGRYDLLPHCGTACGSLHIKQRSSVIESQEPVFLFLDPAPFGNVSYDPFVFATQHHKLRLGEAREVLANVDPSWRPSATDIVSQVTCEVPSKWIPTIEIRLEEHDLDDLQDVYLASAATRSLASTTYCNTSGLPVFWCEFPMSVQTQKELDLKVPKRFELTKNPFSLAPISWLLKTAGHALKLAKWHMLPATDLSADHCAICAPKPPSVVWKIVRSKNRQQIRPFEDIGEASNYERALKAAPEAVTAELSHDGSTGRASMKIDFNILSLVHKAIAALSESGGRIVKPYAVEWRAVIDYCHDHPVPFPHIQLRDCQGHEPASQPPSFVAHGQQLNEWQLKSFHWMINREDDGNWGNDANLWHEQEIVEARVTAMNLRLEAKVTARREIKGGVLADEVGYGKTALVLALIDHYSRKTNQAPPPPFKQDVDDMITLKATLILVPKNITKQWSAEIERFLGTTYEVVVLTKQDFIGTCTVSALEKADIILAPWDLFDDDYFTELARMSRAPNTPVSAGRGFEEWFQLAQADLKTLMKDSHGLQPERLRSAWYGLETKKYNKFVSLSKRNKKGAEASADPESEPESKKAKMADLDIDDIELEAPTYPFLPLHGCIFNRIVVDEFSYIGAKQLPAVVALQASRRWILSGTPQHNTFDGVNMMAKLLGTTIGVPDDADLRYRKVGNAEGREISGGEALRSYTTSHSMDWHKERSNRAVAFVRTFVRQNTAFVRGIMRHDHFEKIELTAPERAAYHECYLVLANQGVKMGKRVTQDKKQAQASLTRTERVVEHITASESPEEALISVCSTMPEFARERSSSSPYYDTIKEKEALIRQKVDDILSDLRGAFWIISHFQDRIQDIPDIHNYIQSVQENRFGDATVRALLDLVIAHAEDTKKWTVARLIKNKEPTGKVSAEKKQQYVLRSDDANEPENLSEKPRAEDLKLRADSLTAWTIALTDLVRERRFFIGTERCQSGTEIECSSCGRRTNDYSTMLFMGRCGHAGCKPCYLGLQGPCGLSDQCPDTNCGSKSLKSSTVMASDLTIALSEDVVREHGSKMVAIANLLLRLPKGEKALVFVQTERIITALRKVLGAHGIKYADTVNSPRAAAEVDRFQKAPTCKVCLLQLDSANAAGWNLQVANHVVFVSSMVTKTQYEYKSGITQAIGRVLRMGQTKDVQVHHFLAEKTVDVNIIEDRLQKVLVDRGGRCLLVAEDSVLPTDRRGFAGVGFWGAVNGTHPEDDGEEEEG